MGLRVYNTLTRQKDEFVPLEEGKVRMYSCGPTVYDYFHIGNARAFVVPDLIRKYLQYKGYDVTYVQNITDIEDKIIKRAKERGVRPEDIVNEFTQAFFDDRALLGVTPPDFQPRATEYISEIVSMVQKLISNGLAYERNGDVYFDVSAFPNYGKLSNQSIEDLQAGARVDVGEMKDDPLDFALWKAAKPGEPSWDSPWGKGRPGWHIECSAMSSKLLGETFDIHCGGIDLVFPHHENEIAQSEGTTGKQFVKYWVHNGFVNINGQRMGKSLGNFKTIRDITKSYPGRVIRYFLISTHYRKPVNFSDQEMEMCSKSLERLENTVFNALHFCGLKPEEIKSKAEGVCKDGSSMGKAIEKARGEFVEYMDDDFNSAGAIAVMHDLATALNSFMNKPDEGLDRDRVNACVASAISTLVELGTVLGFMDGEDTLIRLSGTKTDSSAEGDTETISKLLDLLLSVRAEVRAAKQWAISDQIRDGLKEMGIVVEDTKDGTRWKYEAK